MGIKSFLERDDRAKIEKMVRYIAPYKSQDNMVLVG